MPKRRSALRGERGSLLATFVMRPCAVLACSLLASGAAWGAMPVPDVQLGLEFSAKVVWRSDGKVRDALLFVKGDRYRIEHRGGVKTDLGYASVSIVREDRQEVWYVLSQRRSYLALPLTPAHKLPLTVRLEGEITRTLVGDAMTAGRSAQLFEVVVERYGRRETYFQWVDAEHGLLLKLLSKHRDWSVEYEHVVYSEQPSFYFEVPRGYFRIDGREPSEEGG